MYPQICANAFSYCSVFKKKICRTWQVEIHNNTFHHEKDSLRHISSWQVILSFIFFYVELLQSFAVTLGRHHTFLARISFVHHHRIWNWYKVHKYNALFLFNFDTYSHFMQGVLESWTSSPAEYAFPWIRHPPFLAAPL